MAFSGQKVWNKPVSQVNIKINFILSPEKLPKKYKSHLYYI